MKTLRWIFLMIFIPQILPQRDSSSSSSESNSGEIALLYLLDPASFTYPLRPPRRRNFPRVSPPRPRFNPQRRRNYHYHQIERPPVDFDFPPYPYPFPGQLPINFPLPTPVLPPPAPPVTQAPVPPPAIPPHIHGPQLLHGLFHLITAILNRPGANDRVIVVNVPSPGPSPGPSPTPAPPRPTPAPPGPTPAPPGPTPAPPGPTPAPTPAPPGPTPAPTPAPPGPTPAPTPAPDPQNCPNCVMGLKNSQKTPTYDEWKALNFAVKKNAPTDGNCPGNRAKRIFNGAPFDQPNLCCCENINNPQYPDHPPTGLPE